MSYATLAQLRQYLSQIGVDAESDALLTAILTRATDAVRNVLRASLGDPTFDYTAYGAAATKIVYGYASTYLRLPAYQLNSVTLVEYQSGTNPSAYTALGSTEWEETGDGRLYRASGWNSGGDSRYRITAAWGYGDTVPPIVEEVTLELSVNIWRSKDKGGFSDTIGTDGQGATTQVSGLTNLQKQSLQSIMWQLYQVPV